MPKQVDHAARREELAGALWRLVVREGIEAASLRRVAAEAGWSVGSLRHYFTTQSELLTFAMELVVQRVTERVSALPPRPEMRDSAREVLEQVLPLDADRRAEMQVWIAFTTRSLTDASLRPLRDEAHSGLRRLCRDVAAALGAGDPEREGQRLHAFVDGLALHAILAPGVTTPARQRELLEAQLARY